MTVNSNLNDVTRQNVNSIAQMETASIHNRTPGERCADAVAAFVGSWTFLISQSLLLVGWMTLNITGWWTQWDVYPFVLLNLVLSFQAAFATPIILMSENRQARLSERRSHLDLQVNLLAEQENTKQLRLLRLICEKLDIEITDEMERALEQPTKPEEITRQIVTSVQGTET